MNHPANSTTVLYLIGFQSYPLHYFEIHELSPKFHRCTVFTVFMNYPANSIDVLYLIAIVSLVQ